MTSISSLQFTSLQITGQGNTSAQAGGDFNALLSRLSDRKDAVAGDVKTYSVGNSLNIDMTAFGIGDDSTDAKTTDPLMGLIDALFNQAQGKKTVSQGGSYPFTSEFQSVFGTDGPLFDFINATTASLGLTPEKNLALQNIAINNKDATRSPDSIAKIRGELQAAGIG